MSACVPRPKENHHSRSAAPLRCFCSFKGWWAATGCEDTQAFVYQGSQDVIPSDSLLSCSEDGYCSGHSPLSMALASSPGWDKLSNWCTRAEVCALKYAHINHRGSAYSRCLRNWPQTLYLYNFFHPHLPLNDLCLLKMQNWFHPETGQCLPLRAGDLLPGLIHDLWQQGAKGICSDSQI